MKRKSLRALTALLLTVLLCIACNAAAPLIDTPAMRQNAAQGAAMLHDQYPIPQMVGGFKSAQLDNYTAVLMVKTAAYTGEETWLHKAFGGLRTDMPITGGQSEWDAYCTYADGSLSPTQGLSYTRYWHGYTLPLRILLCVLNLANIQMLLFFVQLALMMCTVHLMIRRGLSRAVPAFFTAYFLMMPFALGVCVQYATASLPMLIFSIALLLWDERIDSAVGIPVFFAVAGIITNFVDLLTFPLVTLGFPLTLLILLRLRRGDSLMQLLVLSFLCCMGWGLGFGGMWALKWVITAACFGWDRLHTIISQIFLRVGADSGGVSFTRMSVLKMNLDVILGKASYLLILALTALASVLPSIGSALKEKCLCFNVRALALLFPAAVSLAWYIVMANHSYDHTYFTYRSLTIGVFAGMACLSCLTDSLLYKKEASL